MPASFGTDRDRDGCIRARWQLNLPQSLAAGPFNKNQS